MALAAKAVVAGVEAKAPAQCRGCAHFGTMVPILYGFHAAEAEARARRGEAVLGQFSGGPEAARWECLTCGARAR